MSRLFIRFFMVAAIAMAATASLTARAGPLSEADAVKVRAVIQAQLASFAMERQADSSWRISGCAVAENHWRGV